MKIIGNCEKLVCNLYDKENYFMYITTLMQALDRVLILEKVHRVIEFNQETWLKSCIDKKAELTTKILF